MSESDGLGAGIEESRGDPRVVLALNALLSTAFAATIVWGMNLLGVAEFTALNVVTLAIVLFAVAYAMSR